MLPDRSTMDVIDTIRSLLEGGPRAGFSLALFDAHVTLLVEDGDHNALEEFVQDVWDQV